MDAQNEIKRTLKQDASIEAVQQLLADKCYDPRQFGVIDPPYLRANRAVCPTAI